MISPLILDCKRAAIAGFCARHRHQTRTLQKLGLAAAASFSLLAAPASKAATYTWTGANDATDTNWSDTANWSPTGAPGITTGTFTDTDLAIFSGTPASLSPNLDASFNVGSVMFGASAVSGAFTLGAINSSSLILSGVSASPTVPTATSAGGNQIVDSAGAPTAAGAQYQTISAPIILENTSGTATGSGQFYFAANGGSTTTGVTSTSFLSITGNVTGSASASQTSTLTLYGGNNTRNLGYNQITGIISDGSNGGKLAVAFQEGNQFGTNGSTTWYLSGANTYSGGTLINTNGYSGNLRVGNSSALGTGTVTWTATGGNQNSLYFGASSLNLANAQTISSGTATFNTSSFSGTLSGLIGGSGALALNGGNTLTLSQAESYSGATSINQGVLQTTNTNSVLASSSSVFINSGASLDVDGNGAEIVNNLSGAGSITSSFSQINSGVSLVNTSNTAFTGVINANIGSNATVAKSGAATLTLSGVNTYTAATAVNAGTLTLGITKALGSTSGITVASGATLSLAATSALATPGATTSTTAGSPVSVGGQVPITLSGGTLLRTGAGVSLGSQSGTAGTVGIGTLTLTAPSTIDYGTTGVGTLNFNGVSGLSSANTLSIIDFTTTHAGAAGTDGTDDRFIVNQNLASVLGDISIDGTIATSEIALGNGEYELLIPEPSAWAAGVLGFCVLGFVLRRRLAIRAMV